MRQKTEPTKLTPAQVKALTILKDLAGITRPMTASRFAEYMWKESKPHLFTKVSNQGNGACRGKAAWRCAGGWLGKLLSLNLVRFTDWNGRFGYYISGTGERLLKEANETKK